MFLYNAIRDRDKEKFNELIKITDVNETGETCNDTILARTLFVSFVHEKEDLHYFREALKRGADVNYLRWPNTINEQTYVGTAMLHYSRDDLLPTVLSLLVKYGLTYKTLMKTRKHFIQGSSLCERMYDRMLRYFQLFPFLLPNNKIPDSLKYVIYSFL